MLNVTVYTKDGCNYCVLLKKFLKENAIPFYEKSLGKDFTPDQFISRFGQNGIFPRVEINDELIGGLRETVEYCVENHLVE